MQGIDQLPPKGVRPPIIGPGQTLGTLTDRIAGIVLTKHTPVFWFLVVGLSVMIFGILNTAVAYLFVKGTGIWGINIPVGWGFAIVNFVWWIGIGHAGTLISAILLLFKQTWRTSINRFAEGMTIFAVMQAGLFPLIHTGRPWLAFYWLLPYPNSFAVSVVPRWHTTFFPPSFVAGAIYSGFAMVLILAIPFRYLYGMQDYITLRHLQNSAKLMLATGMIVAYAYGLEMFMGWYSNDKYELAMVNNRLHGPYSHYYFMLLLCNIRIPHSLWFHKLRSTPWMLFQVQAVVKNGIWRDRLGCPVQS